SRHHRPSTLPLHDALPTFLPLASPGPAGIQPNSQPMSRSPLKAVMPEVPMPGEVATRWTGLHGSSLALAIQSAARKTENVVLVRSEEHTSELQSRENLVSR